MTQKDIQEIYHEPNKFARPASLEVQEDHIVFHGYQEYSLTKKTISVSTDDLNLKKKRELISPYFSPRFLDHRAVLDLGANAGFFSFWALQKGAEKAIAIDMDEDYVQILKKAKSELAYDNLDIEKVNIMDWNEPEDIVLANALVHWLYSCTAQYGSLDCVIEKLRQITKYMLIVEWIAPDDPAINFFHHLEWNKEIIRGEYTQEAFEAALDRYFKRHELISRISPTRILYVAFCTPREIDLSGPLPLIMDKEKVIYSRCLSRSNGIDYWSRLYDDGEIIYKQATLDLAEREAHFLNQIECDYFPKVLDSRSEGEYSVIILEKIQGKPLKEAIAEIIATPEGFHEFIKHGLNILEILRKKAIIHRDIRLDNILIRDKKPVLIDFGWSISSDRPYITPPGLGCSERPIDGSFCDVYSMGKVFQQINKQSYHCFDLIIELMTEEDVSLRVTDLEMLKVLFSSESHGDKMEDKEP